MDEWQQRMRRARPEELVRIAEAATDEGFEAEAIAAAREELASRNLSGDYLTELQADARELELEESGVADKSLSPGGVFVFVIFGPFLIFSLFGLFVFYAMWARGRKRMVREAFGAGAMGLMLWGLLLVVAAWLSSR